MNSNTREACPACGGNGFVTVVPERRPRRKRAPVTADIGIAELAEKRGYTDLAMTIVGAFRQTFHGVDDVTLPEHGRSILRQEVGRVFEEARLAWDRLNPEPPLSEFNSIACELGAFPDFPIGDRGESISIVVSRYISEQFVKRRAAGLLKSPEGRARIGCIVATLADSLQHIGVNNTRPLWDLADSLRGAP